MTKGVAELLSTLIEGQETVFDLVDALGGSGKRLEVSYRPVQPIQPDVARALAVDHKFHDTDAFCQYLMRVGSKETSVVLADVNRRQIVAILDESMRDDRERVTLDALEHPLFTPWSRLLEKPLPVIDFALFVMQHRRAVLAPDGRDLALMFSQIKMSKAISIFKGVGKKSLNGVLVDVEIAGEKKGVPIELPETITIQVPLFVGTELQAIELDLLVTCVKGDEVVVFITAADVESQRIAAFEAIVDKIREVTGHLVGLGEIHEREWRVVK